MDSGRFKWDVEKYPGMADFKKFGPFAYTAKLRNGLFRNTGACLSPQNAFYLMNGLESLHVRMERHCKNAKAIATYLKNNEKVAWVSYPDLEDDSYNELAKKYLPNGSCGVLSFGLKGGREESIKFMDSLKLAAIATHVADAKTCLLHPASHTHRQMTEEQLREAGVASDLIRLSVGLENVDDLIADFEQAFAKI